MEIEDEIDATLNGIPEVGQKDGTLSACFSPLGSGFLCKASFC